MRAPAVFGLAGAFLVSQHLSGSEESLRRDGNEVSYSDIPVLVGVSDGASRPAASVRQRLRGRSRC